MKREWDEVKRQRTLNERALDFADAELIPSGPHLRAPVRMVPGEVRWIATGLIEDVHVTVVFTERGSATRIISMRRARDDERRKYQEVFKG
ncbi:MAG TPA: BrnT family toxin [Acetobacteraceae bacterium]